MSVRMRKGTAVKAVIAAISLTTAGVVGSCSYHGLKEAATGNREAIDREIALRETAQRIYTGDYDDIPAQRLEIIPRSIRGVDLVRRYRWRDEKVETLGECFRAVANAAQSNVSRLSRYKRNSLAYSFRCVGEDISVSGSVLDQPTDYFFNMVVRSNTTGRTLNLESPS